MHDRVGDAGYGRDCCGGGFLAPGSPELLGLIGERGKRHMAALGGKGMKLEIGGRLCSFGASCVDWMLRLLPWMLSVCLFAGWLVRVCRDIPSEPEIFLDRRWGCSDEIAEVFCMRRIRCWMIACRGSTSSTLGEVEEGGSVGDQDKEEADWGDVEACRR